MSWVVGIEKQDGLTVVLLQHYDGSRLYIHTPEGNIEQQVRMAMDLMNRLNEIDYYDDYSTQGEH